VAEIKVLSAGAVRAGLSELARAFEAETGHKVVITFATAPVLREKVEEEKEPADVVIAPLPIIKDFEKNERIVPGSSAVVGKVRAAVVVRDGPWEPDISTVEALKEAI
jgi:molybdate transport system substrate-binding protein